MQECFMSSLVEISPVVLEKSIGFRHGIFSISLLSPRGKWHDPSFESTWIPFTQGGFHLSWLKLAQLFWGGRFLNSVHVFALIRYYFHFEKDVVFYLIFKHEF